jgi:hypothetical protein
MKNKITVESEKKAEKESVIATQGVIRVKGRNSVNSGWLLLGVYPGSLSNGGTEGWSLKDTGCAVIALRGQKTGERRLKPTHW